MAADTAMNKVSSLTLRTGLIAKLIAFHPLKRPGYPGILESFLITSSALDFSKLRLQNSTKLRCKQVGKSADFRRSGPYSDAGGRRPLTECWNQGDRAVKTAENPGIPGAERIVD